MLQAGHHLYTTTAPSCCIPAPYCHMSATLQTMRIVVNLQDNPSCVPNFYRTFKVFIWLLGGIATCLTGCWVCFCVVWIYSSVQTAKFVLPAFKFLSATSNVYLSCIVMTLPIGRSGFDYSAVMNFYHSVLASCGSHPAVGPTQLSVPPSCLPDGFQWHFTENTATIVRSCQLNRIQCHVMNARNHAATTRHQS